MGSGFVQEVGFRLTGDDSVSVTRGGPALGWTWLRANRIVGTVKIAVQKKIIIIYLKTNLGNSALLSFCGFFFFFFFFTSVFTTE